MYTQLCSVQNNEKELLGPSMGYVQRHNDWRIILILSCRSSSSVYPPWSQTDLMSDCTDWNGLWSCKTDLLKHLKQFEDVYELFKKFC